MKGRFLIVSLPFVLLTTLCSCEFYGNKDLGNKLTLFARDSPEGHYDIIYCSRYDIGGCIAGMYVIPSADEKYSMYVETAKADKKWVIAKTVRVEDKKRNYWIIDKSFDIEGLDCDSIDCDSVVQSHVIEALDSLAFDKKVRELDIKLKF